MQSFIFFLFNASSMTSLLIVIYLLLIYCMLSVVKLGNKLVRHVLHRKRKSQTGFVDFMPQVLPRRTRPKTPGKVVRLEFLIST